MNTKELLMYIENGGLAARLEALYGADKVAMQTARYAESVKEWIEYIEREYSEYSKYGHNT